MKSKPNPGSDKKSAVIDDLLRKLYAQAKAQFGDAIQSYWFYDGERCPGCTRRSIGPLKLKGQDALSLNAFLYNEADTLISYFLCETCAKKIFRAAKINPYGKTPLHAEIERNLIAAYHKRLEKLDA